MKIMFFVVHTNYQRKSTTIVDNTTLYANTKKQMMDYVSTKCDATHIENTDEVKELGRYFMVAEDMGSINIYDAINVGYVYDSFEIQIIEKVDIVKYELKSKTYAECLKDKMNDELNNGIEMLQLTRTDTPTEFDY